MYRMIEVKKKVTVKISDWLPALGIVLVVIGALLCHGLSHALNWVGGIVITIGVAMICL